MKKKRCAVCGEVVGRRTGTHYANRLIHKRCVGMAIIIQKCQMTRKGDLTLTYTL
ncbi:MAG: hypothetical protein ACE5K4_07750 [Candidatus Hydrothermarchaeota archaeon]